ncbi:MAG: carbohydrate binding domain-containing protein, partial [Bacteroidales bacterium]
AQTNIVTNGTFEDGSLTGWNTLSQNGAAMSVSAVGTNPLSGTKSMLVNITAVDATLQYWTQKISWRLSLTKNAVYKISFKAKASVATTLKGFINRYSWPWEAVSNNDYSLTTTSQNFEFTTNPISHVLGADYSFDFYVGQIPNGTQVWIDDVSIVEVTSPLTDGNLCNGDFENDVINSPYPFTNPQTLLSGWTENDYGRGYIQYSIDNTAPISGTNSFKAHSVNGPDDNGWRSQLMWQFTPIVGQKYMLEFDAKSDVNFSMNAEAFVEYTGSIRPNNLFNQAFNITTGTNHYKLPLPSAAVTQTPDLGPYTLAFWLGLLPTGNNVWIDNVKIYQYTDTVTAVNQIGQNKNISVSSRNNKIVIKTSELGEANIYSISGQLVKHIQIVSGDNMVTVNKGMYIVKTSDDKNRFFSSKVVVE